MINYFSKFSLKGKNAVVVGGAGLIGSQITAALAQVGARVVVADIDRAKGAKVCADLAAAKLAVEYVNFDVTQLEALETGIKALASRLNCLDIWINCTYPRTDDWGASLEDITSESWRKNVDIHLNSYSLSAKYAAQNMKEKGGSIILVSSIYGLVGPDFSVYQGTDMTMPFAYSAIKGGIVNVSRYLASYFGKYNIRVNSICPGGVFDNQNQKFVDNYQAKTLLKRMAKPEEIASAVLFLSTEAASYVTGIALAVDGGWTAI